ncbi:flagellar FliJ family protein [Telmatospirillum sp. J64-1]|uniref:flagellar FliJ family protein n=1 Tax=Telmatospirillum sp. J64-1 TaxID=2502183 RepID=UPI00115EDC2E|nr:flagellar FliJ family protein [Telmatospirillum sp. J64-1]
MARKDLHSLLRLSRWEVDEARRALGALLSREEEIQAYIAALDEEVVQERKQAAQDVLAAGPTFTHYLQHWRQRRSEAEQAMEELSRQIAEAQEALAEAYRQQKTYELAQKSRDEHRRREEDQREQQFLDEIAQNSYLRNKE